MSLFGGPLSTRNACVNTHFIEKLKYYEQQEALREAQKQAKKLGGAAANTPGAVILAPIRQAPANPTEVKKKKLKEDLNLFDDLAGGGPGNKDDKKDRDKLKARSSSPSPGPCSTSASRGNIGSTQLSKQSAVGSSQKAGSSSLPGKTGAISTISKPGSKDGQQQVRKHGVPLKTLPPSVSKPGLSDKKGLSTNSSSIKPGMSGPSRFGAGAGGAGKPGVPVAKPGAPGQPAAGKPAAPLLPRDPIKAALSGFKPGMVGGKTGPQQAGGGQAGGKKPVAGQPSGMRQAGLSRPGMNGVKRRRDYYDEDDYEDDGFVVDDLDEPDWRQQIRGMFKYNPRRFDDEEDDDRAMEVGYDSILAEEKRSLKLAREEDLREEEAERQRALAKAKLKGKRARSSDEGEDE